MTICAYLNEIPKRRRQFHHGNPKASKGYVSFLCPQNRESHWHIQAIRWGLDSMYNTTMQWKDLLHIWEARIDQDSSQLAELAPWVCAWKSYVFYRNITFLWLYCSERVIYIVHLFGYCFKEFLIGRPLSREIQNSGSGTGGTIPVAVRKYIY